jgi:hypothetical protein
VKKRGGNQLHFRRMCGIESDEEVEDRKRKRRLVGRSSTAWHGPLAVTQQREVEQRLQQEWIGGVVKLAAASRWSSQRTLNFPQCYANQASGSLIRPPGSFSLIDNWRPFRIGPALRYQNSISEGHFIEGQMVRCFDRSLTK